MEPMNQSSRKQGGELARIGGQIQHLYAIQPTLTALAPLLVAVSLGAALLGLWLVTSILGALAIAAGGWLWSTKKQLVALEYEEAHLIEAGDIDDDI